MPAAMTAGADADIPFAHKDALLVRSHYGGISITRMMRPARRDRADLRLCDAGPPQSPGRRIERRPGQRDRL